MVHRPSTDPRIGPPYDDAEIVGSAPWPAIIPEVAWRAVCAILTDPARSNGSGNAPRWLGSRIYRCGRCEHGTTLVVMGSDTGAKRYSRYTCPASWHLARAAYRVDEFVEATLIARLERPDAADLIPAVGGADLAALYAEEASLRELLNEQARLHARKVIDGQQLEAGSRELRVDLTRVRTGIAVAERTSPLAGIAGRPDAARIWKGLDLGRKRALLRVLADVTLLPAVQRGPRFDPDSVDIDFKRSAGDTSRAPSMHPRRT
jgi:hypothetical protein